MKILTYNIHGWCTTDGRPNVERLTQVLLETEADIIGLNEVFYPRTVESDKLNSNNPALELLASQLNMHFVFGPCLRWPAQDHMPADAYGNALLSRWPIIASASHHLTPVEGKEQRGLLEARILRPNKQTFTVYVTHLDSRDEETRLIQLRALRSWTVRDRNRPHLLMGDFNALSQWDFADRQTELQAIAQHPESAQLAGGEKGPRVIAQIQKSGYTDCYAQLGEPSQSTFIPAEQMGKPIRLDYIFASKSLTPSLQSCKIWPEPNGQEASDHRPLLAEFTI